jgi:hypothetical protein
MLQVGNLHDSLRTIFLNTLFIFYRLEAIFKNYPRFFTECARGMLRSLYVPVRLSITPHITGIPLSLQYPIKLRVRDSDGFSGLIQERGHFNKIVTVRRISHLHLPFFSIFEGKWVSIEG